MYIITARRITSGELLKYRKGFCIGGSYGSSPGASSQFALTMPLRLLSRGGSRRPSSATRLPRTAMVGGDDGAMGACAGTTKPILPTAKRLGQIRKAIRSARRARRHAGASAACRRLGPASLEWLDNQPGGTYSRNGELPDRNHKSRSAWPRQEIDAPPARPPSRPWTWSLSFGPEAGHYIVPLLGIPRRIYPM